MNAADDPFPLDQMRARMESAEADLRASRLQQAFDGYREIMKRLLDRRTEGGKQFRGADLMVIERLAELAVLFGHAQAADDLLRAMVTLCDEAGNTIAADYARLKRVEVLLGTGRFDDAVGRFSDLASHIGALEDIATDESGLDAWEARIVWRNFPADERTVCLTRAYLVMGGFMMRLGVYGDALRMLERGLHHTSGAGSQSLVYQTKVGLHASRARALLEAGRLDDARAALAQCGAEPQSPAARLQTLELEGKIALLRGELSSAVQHLRNAMTLCASNALHRAQAVATLNLAHSLVLLNRVEEALSLIDNAHALACALGDQVLLARAQSIQHVALARRVSSAQAVEMTLSVTSMTNEWSTLTFGPGLRALPTQIGETSDRDSFLAQFEDRALVFQWELATHPAQAVRSYNLIEQAYAHSDSGIIKARLLVLEGMLRSARADHTGAEACYVKATARFKVLGFVPELWRLTQQRAENLMHLGRVSESEQIITDAAQLLDTLCASLPGPEQAIFLLNKFTAQESELKARVDELVRAMEVTRAMRPWRRLYGRYVTLRRLSDVTNRLHAFKAGLAGQQIGASENDFPVPAANGVGRIVRMFGAMALAPRDRAVVSFIVLPDRVLVMWSMFLGAGFAVRPVTRGVLRDTVAQWHQLAQHEPFFAVAGDAQEVEARQRQVDELLVKLGEMLNLDAWIGALPPRIERLTIIADDVLHGLPFAALKHGGRYLVERFAISFGFHSPGYRPRDDHIARGKGLVVGVAQAPGEATLELVGAECARADAWLRAHGMESSVFLDEQACHADITRELCEASIAHFACHSVFEPDAPDKSGLWIKDELGTSRRLTIRDLAALRLSACRHVTLSACWSADSYVIPGRWVISLPEVLWRSGVHSVLASLWQVADDIGEAFMNRFYDNLERLPRDLALRDAQLQCLHNALSVTSHNVPISAGPFFWAGFVLNGAPGRIRLPQQRR
jgi:tetratricopeptide (TPR) repeat protein